MSAGAWISSRVSWSGVPGRLTTMFSEDLYGDLGFGDAGSVHALADDLHRLLQLFVVDLLAGVRLGESTICVPPSRSSARSGVHWARPSWTP